MEKIINYLINHGKILGYQVLRGLNGLEREFPNPWLLKMSREYPRSNENPIDKAIQKRARLCHKIALCYSEVGDLNLSIKYNQKV
tara:strand:- start:77 stop:331 length:255 start_codon:yes stop_codon:yes gene_type:complete